MDSEMGAAAAGECLPGDRGYTRYDSRHREAGPCPFLQPGHGMALSFAFESQACETTGGPAGVRMEGHSERDFASRKVAKAQRKARTAA